MAMYRKRPLPGHMYHNYTDDELRLFINLFNDYEALQILHWRIAPPEN